MTQGARPDAPVIGILGGTGPQGAGLARQFAARGLTVILGSRSAERATELAAMLPGDVQGATNADCASRSDLVIVAVPFDGHAALLASLRSELDGKVVIDCVNPLRFGAGGPYALRVPEGSACEQAQALLPGSAITGAFHHLSAVVLAEEPMDSVNSDVLVVGDDARAVEDTLWLAGQLPGARPVYAGRLRNAGQVESFTANLIVINKRYKAHAGVRITDVEPQDSDSTYAERPNGRDRRP